MNMFEKELNGAWEEKGVIGTRVEIAKNKIAILWRNSPVCETTFKIDDHDGFVELVLKKRGKRYKNSDSDYSQIQSIKLIDGKMEIIEIFPITGESKTVLEKTENSRYGNYDINDNILKDVQGEWVSEDGCFGFTIKKDVMIFNNKKIKIHVLQSRNSSGEYLLANNDSSVYDFGPFSRLSYINGTLQAWLVVLDAGSTRITFTKKD